MNTVLIILLLVAVAVVAVETFSVIRHDRGATPPPRSHDVDPQFVGPAYR